jgi:hypothetical protein
VNTIKAFYTFSRTTSFSVSERGGQSLAQLNNQSGFGAGPFGEQQAPTPPCGSRPGMLAGDCCESPSLFAQTVAQLPLSTHFDTEIATPKLLTHFNHSGTKYLDHFVHGFRFLFSKKTKTETNVLVRTLRAHQSCGRPPAYFSRPTMR